MLKEIVMVEHSVGASRPRRRLPLMSSLLAAMLAAVTLSVPQAGAVTSWKKFGGASAVNRGTFSWPDVSVRSTTKQNPVRVRFVVTGKAIKTRVSWSIDCWNESTFKNRSASGSFSRKPPITVDISNGSWVSNFQFCALYVSAYHFQPGDLQLKLQAKYP
jgi:hypothetical protein